MACMLILLQRSALAYRHDSADGGIVNHISVGISTTSTTSKSTSKSSGGIYKGEDYLRSTNTSSSGGIPAYKHSKSVGIPPPYGYDPEKSPQLDGKRNNVRELKNWSENGDSFTSWMWISGRQFSISEIQLTHFLWILNFTFWSTVNDKYCHQEIIIIKKNIFVDWSGKIHDS